MAGMAAGGCPVPPAGADPTPTPTRPRLRRSWGGLGWLIPSEIQPLPTRSAGFSLSVSMNFLSCFILGGLFELAVSCVGRLRAADLYACACNCLTTAPRARPLPPTPCPPAAQCFLPMLCAMK